MTNTYTFNDDMSVQDEYLNTSSEFEISKTPCPDCGLLQVELIPVADGPDDFTLLKSCLNCGYKED